MSESYKYFAFISYSTNDKERAEDLHFFLEKYRLPSIIREEIRQKENRELPETISPIFRDVTGLPPGELREILRQELDDSKFLIVVCSPESAKSPWVNCEIECFIEDGRYDNIIPYIISGKVEDSQNSCYPPILRQPPIFQNHPQFNPNDPKNVRDQRKMQASLREQLKGRSQLVGVALDREGETVAQTKIVAKMLGLDPSVILDWEGFIEQVEAERKERVAKIATQKRLFWQRLYLALGLGVVISLLLVLGWYFTQVNHVYQIIDYDNNKRPLSISYFKWYTPTTCAEGYSKKKIAYNQNSGKILRESYYDINGHPFLYEGKYYRREVKYNEDTDDISCELFFNGDDKVVERSIREIYSVTQSVQKIENGHVIAYSCEKTYKSKKIYDDRDNVIEISFFDENECLTMGPDGIASSRFLYDYKNNLVEETYFDVEGKPCLNNEGIAGWNSEYEGNNEIKRSFFGVNGEPVALVGDDPFDSWEKTYHENGKMATQTSWYYNVKPHPDGYRKQVWTFDEDGNRIKEELFDEEGKNL